jgi:hypothetical protein
VGRKAKAKAKHEPSVECDSVVGGVALNYEVGATAAEVVAAEVVAAEVVAAEVVAAEAMASEAMAVALDTVCVEGGLVNAGPEEVPEEVQEEVQEEVEGDNELHADESAVDRFMDDTDISTIMSDEAYRCNFTDGGELGLP